MLRVAIAGNPNSGKTTLFNLITGSKERVGNWSGVTVANKESFLRNKFNTSGHDVIIVDLPGTYSLDAYSNDELTATEFLKTAEVQSIINVVDASNLERSLKFTLELIETGIPVVVALNKSDITKRKGTKIDIALLEEMIGAVVVETTATSKKGVSELVLKAIQATGVKENGEKRRKKHRRIRASKACGCS